MGNQGHAHTLYEHLNGQKEEVDQGLAAWDDENDTEEGVDPNDDPDAQGSLFSSTITLANSAIGAGVLAFPYAFRVSLCPFLKALCTTSVLILVVSFGPWLAERGVGSLVGSDGGHVSRDGLLHRHHLQELRKEPALQDIQHTCEVSLDLHRLASLCLCCCSALLPKATVSFLAVTAKGGLPLNRLTRFPQALLWSISWGWF